MNPHCWCGRAAVLRTSWTDANPGRRFWGCCRYMEQRSSACNYHLWFDPPMCPRARAIIPGLLRKLEKLEEEGENLKAVITEMKRKRGWSLFVCVGIGFIFLSFVMKNYDGEVVLKRHNELAYV